MNEAVRAVVLGSGSGGNALLVEADGGGGRLLIEAGLPPKVAIARAAALGIALDGVAGIVVSHAHGDHAAHARALSDELGAPLFLHPGLPEPARVRVPVCRYQPGRPQRIAGFMLEAVRVPHDAAHVALRLDDGRRALGVATDVGRVTKDLLTLLASCDAAIVEANHCEELLAFSDYPPSVKRRLSGGLGHLSNRQAAALAGRLVRTRVRRLWLGHLSRENNTPARALEAVRAAAGSIAVDVLPPDIAVGFEVRPNEGPLQLGLPF